MTHDDQANQVREYLDRALILMREMRVKGEHNERSRRLAVAITELETASMWLNMSQFADKDYSPVLPSRR